MSRNVILVAAIVVIAGFFYMKSSDQQKEMISSQTNQEQSLTSNDSGTQQTEDAVLIENLFKDGIISKIDSDQNPPAVYITADYERIANVDKKTMMKVLFKDLKAKNPSVTSYTIYDEKSGDEIGTYDANGFTAK